MECSKQVPKSGYVEKRELHYLNMHEIEFGKNKAKYVE